MKKLSKNSKPAKINRILKHPYRKNPGDVVNGIRYYIEPFDIEREYLTGGHIRKFLTNDVRNIVLQFSKKIR